MDFAVRASSNSGPGSDSVVMPPADESAVQKFRTAIDPVPPTDSPVDSAKRSEGSQAGGSLGDAILSGMSSLTSQASEAWRQTNAMLTTDMGNMSTADLMRLQGHLHVSSTLLDMAGKTVSKASQDLEQLTKGS